MSMPNKPEVKPTGPTPLAAPAAHPVQTPTPEIATKPAAPAAVEVPKKV